MSTEDAPKRGRGQPTKCTPEIVEAVVSAIRDGVPRHRAARLAGIAPSTLFLWLDEGRKQESGVYSDFLDKVEKASDELCRDAVQVQRGLLDHDDPKVRAAASRFVLSYMFSSEFSTKAQIEATGPGGGPMQHTVEAKVAPMFTDEQLSNMSPEQITGALTGLAKVPAKNTETKE